MRLELFFCGYKTFAFFERDAVAVFGALSRVCVSPKAVRRCEKTGEICFSCSQRAAKRLQGLPLRERADGGLPMLLLRLWHRPGLFCGIFLAVLLTVLSGLFVWEIEVLGNERLSDEEVCAELKTLGVGKGSFLPRVNEDGLAVSLRLLDERISYAAVNRRGTVLQVTLREAERPAEKATAPANLVASVDGVVTMPLIFEGECLVREGEAVRAGQILASGVVDSEKHGYRLTRAAGQVLARVSHTYTVTVPFSYEQKQYVGRDRYEISLFFFDFAGKVFKNTGNYDISCDIIENIKWATLRSGQILPFGIGITAYRPFVLVTAERSAVEARAQAMAELEQLLRQECRDRTLLERHTELCVDARGITLICTAVFEEDIAHTVELT